MYAYKKILLKVLVHRFNTFNVATLLFKSSLEILNSSWNNPLTLFLFTTVLFIKTKSHKNVFFF